MSLKLTLKPGDSVLIGDTRVENVSRGSSTLLINGTIPVLRGEFAVDAEAAHNTPDQLRLVLQKMYLDANVAAHHDTYFKVVGDMLVEHPNSVPFITEINRCLMTGDAYRAIKIAKEYLADMNAPAEKWMQGGAEPKTTTRQPNAA
jgi:flagellar protein FlbT